MSNQPLNQINEQVEKLFVSPARAFTNLTVDHIGQLVNVQLEAGKAYTEAGLKQFSAALDVKDSQDFTRYLEGQQQSFRNLSERVKDDGEKVAALNRRFVEQAQKLAQESAENVSDAAPAQYRENAKRASKAAPGKVQ